MPSGLPARVAIVCMLLLGVTIAHAERRPVAVIDLANDPKTVELAKALNPVLQQHPELRPLADPSIVPELFGELVDDDMEKIVAAQGSKQTAEAALSRFQFEIAEQNAINGMRELEHVTPTTNALALFAQLAFVRGQALLGIPSRAREAPLAFGLAHRLDPAFAPDPARYLPDVVRAFEAAKKAWTGKAPIAVGGIGRLWVDGKEAGIVPLEIELEAGPHVLWLTGAERITTGRQITVTTGPKVTIAIPDAPADARVKVRRARAQLRYAPDAAARAAAMKLVADLVGVRDAVLLMSANKKIVYQTWNAGTGDQPPGFSALRELKNEKPSDLLRTLAPPKIVKDDVIDSPPIDDKKKIVDERRWYERRTVQAGIIVGVAALAIGSYYLYNSLTDSTTTWDPDTQTEARALGVRW